MTKKVSIKKIQKEIWEECRRLKQPEFDGCYTCGKKTMSGSDKQLGHMIPKKICPMSLKYELTFLRWQCMWCNLRLGGNGALFTEHMMKEKGSKEVSVMFQLYHLLKEIEKNITQKTRLDFYLILLEEYKKRKV